MPLRDGIADDPRRMIPLTADQAVRLQLNQEHNIDPAGLVGVFDRPRFEVWTGVTYGPMQPMQSLEWLYLWLACVLDTSLCSMRVDQAVVDSGLVKPMFGRGTMAVPGPGELAYLTWRLAGHTEDSGKIMEIGVIGHSNAGSKLTDRVAEEIRTWSEQHRNRTVQFGIPPNRHRRLQSEDRPVLPRSAASPVHRRLAVGASTIETYLVTTESDFGSDSPVRRAVPAAAHGGARGASQRRRTSAGPGRSGRAGSAWSARKVGSQPSTVGL
ncbi:MAG: hypothetical protein ACRDT0_00820 [Pseudonocardiaceae bacterium]